MRRSKVDRGPVDHRRSPEIVSVEVRVSVDDDGRGGVWRGWRYLGLATVVVVMLAVALALGLSSSGVRSASSATRSPVKDSRSPPPGDRYLLFLVSHPQLSREAERLMRDDHCAASRSAALERAMETLYARAVADATGEVLPGRAKLQTTKYPRC